MDWKLEVVIVPAHKQLEAAGIDDPDGNTWAVQEIKQHVR